MTGAICVLVLTTASPLRATADVLAFGANGFARTSGWTFHGERPGWAGYDSASASVVTHNIRGTGRSAAPADILTLIRDTTTRHQQNRALVQVDLDAQDWHVLFRALIEAESAYNPTAQSPKGAYGLGQLMPGTAKSLGVDPKNVAQNLDGAARYLQAQLAAFKDIDLALAAYNAGPHRVVEFSGVPPFAETQSYIARIHRIRDRLSKHPKSLTGSVVASQNFSRVPVVIDLN